MSKYIAIFEDHDGGRQYISQNDLPGFLTNDIGKAQHFETETYARALAESFAGITITREGSDEVWRPEWIKSVSTELVE